MRPQPKKTEEIAAIAESFAADRPFIRADYLRRKYSLHPGDAARVILSLQKRGVLGEFDPQVGYEVLDSEGE